MLGLQEWCDSATAMAPIPSDPLGWAFGQCWCCHPTSVGPPKAPTQLMSPREPELTGEDADPRWLQGRGWALRQGWQQSGGGCAGLVCFSQPSSRGGPPWVLPSPPQTEHRALNPACPSQERDLSRGEGGLIWFISLFLLPIICGSSSCSDKERRYERTLLAAGIPSFCPLTA